MVVHRVTVGNPIYRLALQLLTATTKLFFKRPPEVQKMLGRLLQKCLAEGTAVALHDKYVSSVELRASRLWCHA